jgi:hypothetical protein
MGTLRFRGHVLAAVAISFCGIVACGGHAPVGVSPYPAKITLSPSTSASLQLGNVIVFLASAQNGSGNNVGVTFTYQSSDTSIVNVAPNGVACAGHWDNTFSVCTPGGIGVAKVTATALGVSSAPTYVFVHPPIDNISVNGILPVDQIIQEPCLFQGQTMLVQAQAFSQGLDITADVGPFTWSADYPSVVSLKPIVDNFTYNIPTNQAIATASAPGMTEIYATAGGVTSTSFQQPQYRNTQGTLSPVLDFFESCPIQNIALEVEPNGSQQTGQTSFVATKGTSQNVVAVVTDVMGNTSLVGSNTPVILTKTPLTWTSAQPPVVGVSTSCLLNCLLTTPLPGSAAVTASCSPPTCNVGFPILPKALATPQALAACAQFFKLPPLSPSCQQFIPLPVYASPAVSPNEGGASISGLVIGASSAASVLATSTNCQFTNPVDCITSVYNTSTSKPVAGNQFPMPSSPTSLLFDPAGDKAYMGSEIEAVTLNPTALGSSSGAFAPLGAVTGRVLAVSNNGAMAVFSDTTLSPNEVFITNATVANAPGVTVLNINAASAAGFSPDNLKAFIFGYDKSGAPNLYIYSTIQGLQTFPLPAGTTINSFAFSNNGAFAYVVEPSLAGAGPALTVYNVCDNSVATDLNGVPQIIPLAAPPISFKALPDGSHFIALEQNGTFDYIQAQITGIPVATVTAPASSICPMSVGHSVTNLSLNQGTIHPIDFFPSPDNSLLYVVASDRASVLVYAFGTGATTGIDLVGNALPVQVGLSPDSGTIVIAASDGMLHSVSTAIGGVDLFQTPFPNIPNYFNPFCTFTPAGGPCALNLIAVRP